MRILFVGDLNVHTRTTQRLDAIRDLGHETVSLSSVPLSSDKEATRRRRLRARVWNKLGLPIDWTELNERICREVASGDFQVVWIEKGLTVRPATLRYLRKQSPATRLVSFSEDDMCVRANRSAYYTRGLPLYDAVFTTKSYNAAPEELPALGAREVVFIDKGYCRWRHRPIDLNKDERKRLGADVGFIGTYERERAELLLHLASNGVHIRIFGNGWSRWVGSHPKMEVHDRPVYGVEYAKAIQATRINLCFLRKANRDLQTDRTMEIPACGGFMLAERTIEHRRLFHEDVEVTCFDEGNPAELLQKVRYYLENDEARRAIASRGRQRCLSSGYSHHERIAQLLTYINGRLR